jgi:GNAT superfamily N-acetyltransferase
MTELRETGASPAAIASVADLLAEVFPKARQLDRAWLEWGYLGNPLGPSISFGAHEGGRVVAHVAGRMLSARVHAGADPARGVLVHHAATHPAFRGRRLLVQLVETMLARAATTDAAFAIAVVNQNSVGAFVKRLGFTAVRPLSVRIGFGPLPRRDPAGSLPPDFEPVRGPEWLAWRLAPPSGPYRMRSAGERCEIWADSGLLGTPILIGETEVAAIAKPLAPFASRSPLRAWAGLDPARRFRGTLHAELPLALRPSPLHLVFRALAPGVAPPAPDRVRFDALDFDAW